MIQEGGEAWILTGVRFPFVLQPLSYGQYCLVSDTYVHSAMGGEVIDRLGGNKFTSLELV